MIATLAAEPIDPVRHDGPPPASASASPYADRAARRPLRLALLAVWLLLVGYLAAHHVFWRDEVRAFTLAQSGAQSGDGLIGMLRAIHGEGHPALWYLLLRIAHDIVPVRDVLPAMGLAIGAAAVGLFLLRAPFRPLVLAIVPFGAWLAYEYSVMARNYGISVLLMFVIADRMAARRAPPWLLGGLLFLLCNTNVPSVLFAAGFLLFRLVEIVTETGLRPSPALRGWTIAAGIAALGVLAAFLTVYPPYNDAAVSPQHIVVTPLAVLKAAVNTGNPMTELMPAWSWALPGVSLLLPLLVAASPFSLFRSPAGFLAALMVLPALLLFFQFVYPGMYRHEALFLGFLVSLHWMVACGRGGAWPRDRVRRQALLPRLGAASLLVLLAIQILPTATAVAQAGHGVVASRARDLGRLLRRPDLANAIVIAEPDVMVETLAYYAPNPTYLIREHRFGRVMRFTAHAQLELNLDDMIATARRLQARFHRPVVIAMQPRLDPQAPPVRMTDSYSTWITIDPAATRRFLAATHRIARFAPTTSDESYDVYVLNAPVTAS